MERTRLVPPDGGWGWVVLFAAVVVNFLIPGTIKSFGVLFLSFLRIFDTTPTEASWVPALCYFLYCFLGPLSSYLSAKYSYRTVTLIGGAFASGGLMLSFFANSVTFLYFSYGIMVGTGAGLSFPVTIYIVSEYFERRRGFATGLCISGSTMGTIVLSPFLQYLINELGPRYACLIVGALVANTLICALVFHPVERHMKLVPIEEPAVKSYPAGKSLGKMDGPDEPATRRSSIVSNVDSVTLDPRHDVRASFMRRKALVKEHENWTAEAKSAAKSKAADSEVATESSGSRILFDWSILCNPLYLIILISNSTSAISNTNFMILLPSYGAAEGYSDEASALLLSWVSLLDLAGRVGGATLSDIDLVPKHYYFVGGLGLSGIALALLPATSDYWHLAVLCGVFGFASGLYIGTTAIVLADMLGPENLTASYGITLCVSGVLQLAGPPLCNAAYERLGTFKPIFFALGCILVCGAALWTLKPLIKRPKSVENGISTIT